MPVVGAGGRPVPAACCVPRALFRELWGTCFRKPRKEIKDEIGEMGEVCRARSCSAQLLHHQHVRIQSSGAELTKSTYINRHDNQKKESFKMRASTAQGERRHAPTSPTEASGSSAPLAPSLRELFRQESASWLQVRLLLCMGFHFTSFYKAVVRKRGSDGKCKYLQYIKASARKTF